MKILLTTLNSQYVHSNPALKYLYTVTADTSADIDIVEFTVNNQPSYVYGEILRANYDMVLLFLLRMEHKPDKGSGLRFEEGCSRYENSRRRTGGQL